MVLYRQVRINTASSAKAGRRSLLPPAIPEEDDEMPQLASVSRRYSNPLPQPKTQQHMGPPPGAVQFRPVFQITHAPPAPHSAGTFS